MANEPTGGGFVHRRLVEPLVREPHVALLARIPSGRVVADAVDIRAFECGEARVEAFGRDGDTVDRDVAGHHALQAQFERLHRCGVHVADAARELRLGHVEMAHLMRGMHTRIGAPGHHEMRQRRAAIRMRGIGRPYAAQHTLQRGLDLTLHGAHAGLRGPAVERKPVIPQINTQTNHGARV